MFNWFEPACGTHPGIFRFVLLTGPFDKFVTDTEIKLVRMTEGKFYPNLMNLLLIEVLLACIPFMQILLFPFQGIDTFFFIYFCKETFVLSLYRLHCHHYLAEPARDIGFGSHLFRLCVSLRQIEVATCYVHKS